MRVEILADTVFRLGPLEDEYGYDANPGMTANGADALSEAAGRMCYQSWNRPNGPTASNRGYLGNILRQGHHSVLEHASVTFLVRSVSRALLTELTRHRHLSFSVVSQRYVPYGETEPVIPPAFSDDAEGQHIIGSAYRIAVGAYEALVDRLMEAGAPRKAAREAARAVLPNAAPVDMVVTGNLRAWRDVLAKRNSDAADAEIREFAREVLTHLRTLAPNSFQDMGE